MNEVLKGKGRMGDFVHQNQVMASEDGFRNVSKIWYNKTISFEQGIESVEAIKSSRRDITELLGDVVVKNDGRSVKVMVDGEEFTPTEHALRQLATWLDTPHTMINYYSRPKVHPNGKTLYTRDERDTELIVRALRLGQSRIRADKPMLFRTYADGTLRAVLSDRYAIIDNSWYLEVLKSAIPGGRLSHWRGDADTLWGNVLIPDTLRTESDSDYGGMLSLSNCEIGMRKLAQYPSVFRAICMNGCIWDQKKGNVYTKIHRGKINLDDVRDAIFANINNQIPLMDEHVKKFLSMRDRKLTTKVSKLIACIAIENDFTQMQAMRVIDEFAQFEKSDKNAFGVINAITRAGQAFDNDSWFSFDNIAGSLMNLSNGAWDNLNIRANALDDETVASAFAVAD
jgi:hypothetical protein